ncbi:hypothetical protein ACWGE0_05080 [Lentzea sp. NPDC054927]
MPDRSWCHDHDSHPGEGSELGTADQPVLIFAAFTLSYLARTFRPRNGGFHVDLRNPLLGPLTAYLPVIAILLIAHYAKVLGASAPWLIWLAVAGLALNAAALLRTG